jgi:hypothetical protein
MTNKFISLNFIVKVLSSQVYSYTRKWVFIITKKTCLQKSSPFFIFRQ